MWANLFVDTISLELFEMSSRNFYGSKIRVQYKLGVTVRRCQQHKAPQYLTDCVTDIANRQRLRSASRHQVFVPRYQLSSLGRRSFAVAGPTTWNSLSADLRDPT